MPVWSVSRRLAYAAVGIERGFRFEDLRIEGILLDVIGDDIDPWAGSLGDIGLNDPA